MRKFNGTRLAENLSDQTAIKADFCSKAIV